MANLPKTLHEAVSWTYFGQIHSFALLLYLIRLSFLVIQPNVLEHSNPMI